MQAGQAGKFTLLTSVDDLSPMLPVRLGLALGCSRRDQRRADPCADGLRRGVSFLTRNTAGTRRRLLLQGVSIPVDKQRHFPFFAFSFFGLRTGF
jgi:hypothetical protein